MYLILLPFCYDSLLTAVKIHSRNSLSVIQQYLLFQAFMHLIYWTQRCAFFYSNLHFLFRLSGFPTFFNFFMGIPLLFARQIALLWFLLSVYFLDSTFKSLTRVYVLLISNDIGSRSRGRSRGWGRTCSKNTHLIRLVPSPM